MTFILLLAASLAAVPADLPFNPDTIVEQVTCRQGGEPRPFPPDTTEFMLDTVPLGATRDPDPVGPPAVASNGTDFLVVWKTPVYPSYAVYGARVSGQGQLLDSAAFCINGSTGDNRPTCAVAWGSNAWLVVWTHSSSSIHGRFVSPGGVVRPEVITVADDAAAHHEAALAYDGSKFIAAWSSQTGTRSPWDIRATPISTAGEVRYPNGLLVYPGRSWRHTNRGTAVSALPGSSLLVWESDQTGEWDIAALMLDSAGVPLDTMPVLVAGEGEEATAAAVATDGTGFLVVWRSGEEALADIHAARVSANGVVLDRPIAVCAHSHAQECPSVTFDGVNYLATWHDWRNGNRDIYGTRVSPTGQVLDPDGVRWTAGPQDETEPVIAAGDSSSLVVWQDWRWSNDADLFATRIGPDASVLDSAFPVPDTQDLTAVFAGQYLPDVAFDGENYLVVWEDHRTSANQSDIYGLRVSPEGARLDPAPFVISAAGDRQQAPAVVFGDSNFLVVWEDARSSSGNNWDIYGARVSQSGAVLDPLGIPVMPRYHYSERVPAVAFDGSRFLVVWQTEGVTALCGRFVDQAGHPLGDSFIVLDQGIQTPYPALAFGESCYLAAWNGVQGVRVGTDGRVLDTTRIRVRDGIDPAVTFDGQDFCVVLTRNSDVYAVRVTQQGEVVDPGGVGVYFGSGSMEWPDVVHVGPDYLFVWQEGNASHQWPLCGAWMDANLRRKDTVRISPNVGRDRTPAVARGPGQQCFVVYACSTYGAGVPGAGVPRVWGRLLYGNANPSPPVNLWPPNGHSFVELPVTLLVDTLRPDLDSFDFRVLEGGDTTWSLRTTSPCCTVPDQVIIPGCMHRWMCRGLDDSLWGPFGDVWQFEYIPLGLEERTGTGLPGLAGASIAKRGRPLVAGLPGSRVGLQNLCIYAADGHRVAVIRPGQDGTLSWDCLDQRGRPVPAGLYVARLTDVAGRVVQRKLVLVE